MSSWCDKLASTPTVGIRMDKQYVPATTTLQALAPIVSTWVDGDKPRFSLEQSDAFSLQLQVHDGFVYAANFESLSVEFKHRMKLRAKSAGLPVAEMTSQARPYTELLTQVTDRVLTALELITSGKNRKLRRLGIVTTTVVDDEAAPPGVQRLLKYVARPWRVSLDSYHLQLTAPLRTPKTTGYEDRCIHTITKSELDEDNLITVILDYQRTFDDEKNLSMSSVRGLLNSVRQSALDYFEDVGQGDRYDDKLIEEG